MNRKDELIAKYNRLASRYSLRYADPASVARRQRELVAGWGAPVPKGSSVLELGCGDGFVTAELVRAGFRVTAVDMAPAMIEATSQRLAAAGLEARLTVADVEEFQPDDDFDVVLGMMRDFYSYVRDTRQVIQRLAARTGRRLIVDLNPRQSDLRAALADVKASGFQLVSWRGFFVPTRHRTRPWSKAALGTAEATPLIRRLILSWKFSAVVKGERATD